MRSKLVQHSVLTLSSSRAIIIKSPRGDANSKPAGAAWERDREEGDEKNHRKIFEKVLTKKRNCDIIVKLSQREIAKTAS